MPLTTITPSTQTTYNTIEDQYNYQTTNLQQSTVPPINPNIYLSRLLNRLFAGATYTDWVCSGLDVTFNTSTINTTTASFTVTPGILMIDSTLAKISSTDTISTSSIASVADGDYQVTIWANYSYSTTSTGTITYTSYVHPRVASTVTTHTTVAPAAFAGTEKILLAIFDATIVSNKFTKMNRQNARHKREIEVHTPDILENSYTMNGTTYIVRGVSNLYSNLSWTTLKKYENIFILDILTYKPFGSYLHYETLGIFSP